jgi:Flp pilus assembly protein TadG
MTLYRRFVAHEKGTVAIISAISIVALLLAAGMAIDYVRRDRAMVALQSAADAAALAAGASEKVGIGDLKKIVKDDLALNDTSGNVSHLDDPEIEIDKVTGDITVSVTGSIDTSLMSIVGINKMDLGASASVRRGSVPPLEIALVLDTTYSMYGSKISTLKTAATNLTKTVLTGKNTKVGVVPFGTYVNVGISRRNEPWVNVGADYSKKYWACNTTYPNASGCTTTTKTCYNDGVPYSCSSTSCSSWGTPVSKCDWATANYTFYGCIGSRDESLHASIGSPSTPYPGFYNTGCAAEIRELTSDLSKATSTISSLSAAGETYLPAGLTWGWNMLTPEAPLTSATDLATMKAKGGKKVMVLMTDGANTLAPYADGTHTYPVYTKYKNLDYTNGLTSKLCENIKADGIQLYTVMFDVTDPALQSMLENCASKTSMSYVAKDAPALVAAFNSIAKELAALRLTK